MRILVTGGCGYIGSVLVPKLVADEANEVTVVDTQWFGNYLEPHERMKLVRQDIREVKEIEADAVIHLAAVANDPTGDLDPKLTWEVNALATMRLADLAARSGVKHFIYASSGSVYGVSSDPDVTEESTLDPISEYNKTKMVAERCVLSYADRMAVQVLRPATVCGFSPRMRLDVVVNMLTMQALTNGCITVLGGTQTRPNIHVEDMTDLYVWMLNRPELTGVYNAGFENLSVLAIAEKVAKRTKAKIKVESSNDPRSYRMNADKLIAKGFFPKRTVERAIVELCEKFRSGELQDNILWHNLKAMPQ